MKSIIQLFTAGFIGAAFGVLTALYTITIFSEMILCSAFNLYFALIFFIGGSYYTYKIIKKNQIQTSLENDTLLEAHNKKQNINGMRGSLGLDLSRKGSNGANAFADNQSMFSDTASHLSFSSPPNYNTPSYDTAGREMFKRHPIILAEKPNLSLALY